MASACPTTTKGFYWLCTLNNPTDEERALLREPLDYVQELWYQDEIGEKEKTLHIQLAMRTTEVRKSAIIKDWPRMWVDKARSKLACINYCKKEDKTAVPGSYVHWTRQTDTTEDVYVPESPYHVMEIISSWVAEENYLSDPEVQYQQAVNDCLRWQPSLLQKLTGTRILPQWRLTSYLWMRRYASVSILEEKPETYPEDCLIGIEDCECSKDNCTDCNLAELMLWQKKTAT